MQDKKQLSIGILTVVLIIIAVVVIIIMGYNIYKLSKDVQNKDREITTLKEEKQNMQQTLETIQNTLNNINVSTNAGISNENNSTTSETKTDIEQVEEIAKNFIKAVNEKDWNTVEAYSNSEMVSNLKQYNISNMKIDDYSDYEQRGDSYCYMVSYDMEYEGSTDPKDFSLGRMFIVDKKNEKFIVNSPFAAGW